MNLFVLRVYAVYSSPKRARIETAQESQTISADPIAKMSQESLIPINLIDKSYRRQPWSRELYFLTQLPSAFWTIQPAWAFPIHCSAKICWDPKILNRIKRLLRL